MKRFANRIQAGALLGKDVLSAVTTCDALVFALPRGGVPIGYGVARALGAPLEILPVRKLGVPAQPELAFGAIAPDGVEILNQRVINVCQLSDDDVHTVEEKERAELDRRLQLFRGERPLPSVHHRTIVLVDDGLATGATMRAAIEWSSVHGAAHIIVAVPVASKPALEELEKNPDCDQVICPYAPEPFYAVGVWYADFAPVSTEEVRELFDRRRLEYEGFPAEAYKR